MKKRFSEEQVVKILQEEKVADQLRETFDFEGTPLLFKAKKRGEKSD